MVEYAAEAKLLAKYIKEVAKLHEESYTTYIDETECRRCKYTISILEAANQICPEEFKMLVYLVLKFSWHDILEWAEQYG